MKRLLTAIAAALLAAFHWAPADTTNFYYVATNGSVTYPFDTWNKAATNIQLAVAVAEETWGPGTNCVVLVSNGTYTMPQYGYYGYRTQTNPVIGSIAGNGATVTVTTLVPHAIPAANAEDLPAGRVGQWVVIKGDTVSNEYRGVWRVASVVDATTYTYRCTGSVPCVPGADARTRAVADWAMVRVTKGITLRSVNGCLNTVLDVNAGTAWSDLDRNRRGIELVATVGDPSVEGLTIRKAFFHNVSFSEANPDANGHRRGIDAYVENRVGAGILATTGRVLNCFVHTSKLESGGGQGLNGAGIRIKNAVVSGCVISNNSIGSWGGGGAGFEIEPGGRIENSMIVFNGPTGEGYTAGDWAGGGGCAKGGTIRNCLFYGNTGVSAGGLHIYGSPTVENCTFSTNAGYTHVSNPQNNDYANDTHSNSAGAVFIRYGSPVLRNNIYYFNLGQPRAGDSYTHFNINTSRLWNPPAGPLDIVNRHSYSCAPELFLATTPGNKTNDPLFVDRPNADYRLSDGSPCINAGTNVSWMTGATDIQGFPRLAGPRVDMGSYERPVFGTTFVVH